MTLDELTLEIKQVCRDPSMEQSITTWLNQAVLELAGSYELPTLRLRTAATLAVTTSNYLYSLSAATHSSSYVYMKRCFRITSSTVEQGFALEPSVTLLDDVDADHSDTGTSVQRVAVEGDQVAIYPKATENLSVWFYRKPVNMAAGTSEPDGIPESYHYRVLVPMVVLRAMRLYPDFPTATVGDETKALQWWTARLNAGLYGDGVQPGMLHFIQKAQRVGTPRVRGAAYGGRVGGRW